MAVKDCWHDGCFFVINFWGVCIYRLLWLYRVTDCNLNCSVWFGWALEEGNYHISMFLHKTNITPRAQPAGSKIGTARYVCGTAGSARLILIIIHSVNGLDWELWKGPVSTWTCISFVAPHEITNFKSDLKPFFSASTQDHPYAKCLKLITAL